MQGFNVGGGERARSTSAADAKLPAAWITSLKQNRTRRGSFQALFLKSKSKKGNSYMMKCFLFLPKTPLLTSASTLGLKVH